MKATHWIIAAAALTFVQPASAAQIDPEVIIYRFPGVRDDGSANNLGIATVFHCTNFSGSVENIRFVTRTFDGAIKHNDTINIPHLFTRTATTHQVLAYVPDLTMNTGVINQGTTAIAATSTNVICTAMTIDAANAKPIGLALRGIRFNPIPGSQE
jgi:hypothetical protein